MRVLNSSGSNNPHKECCEVSARNSTAPVRASFTKLSSASGAQRSICSSAVPDTEYAHRNFPSVASICLRIVAFIGR